MDSVEPRSIVLPAEVEVEAEIILDHDDYARWLRYFESRPMGMITIERRIGMRPSPGRSRYALGVREARRDRVARGLAHADSLTIHRITTPARFVTVTGLS